MFKHAMIEKNEKGVSDGLSQICNIYSNLNFISSEDINLIRKSFRLTSNLIVARSILKAIKLRKESRGSHYRSDYPELNDKMNKPIIIELKNSIDVYFD